MPKILAKALIISESGIIDVSMAIILNDILRDVSFFDFNAHTI